MNHFRDDEPDHPPRRRPEKPSLAGAVVALALGLVFASALLGVAAFVAVRAYRLCEALFPV